LSVVTISLMESGDLPFVKVEQARRIPKRSVLAFATQAL